MLPLILIFILLVLGVVTVLGLVAFLTGLLVAIEFLVVTFLILYALSRLDMIDDDYKWTLVVAPFAMFFVGLGLDKIGVLRIRRLTIQGLASSPLSIESVLLLVLVILAIMDSCLEIGEQVGKN